MAAGRWEQQRVVPSSLTALLYTVCISFLVLQCYCPYAGPGNWDTSSPDCSRQWGFKASLGIRLPLGLGSEILGPKNVAAFCNSVTTACGFFSDSLLPRYPSLSLLSDPSLPISHCFPLLLSWGCSSCQSASGLVAFKV